MTPDKHTLTKSELLSGKKDIQELFTRGSSFYSGSLRIIWLKNSANTRVLFAVPKRNHKKAVIRNKLKRRLREAYRLHKMRLPENIHYDIAYIYTSRRVRLYQDIEHDMILSLETLANENNEN